MDLIKDIVRQCYPLVILSSCVLLVGYMFFVMNFNDGKGVFEIAGSIYGEGVESPTLEYAGLKHLERNTGTRLKSISYGADVKEIGDCINLNSLFQIELEDETVTDIEKDKCVRVYLEDIKNQIGISVLERLSAKEIKELEEITAAFIYEEESDQLYFLSSGVFLVQLKVYGIDGSMGQYEFHLPVEVS